jgi:hypothetical protein
MEATSQVTPANKQIVNRTNQVVITGRIDSNRNFEYQGKRMFEHRVILPAVDQFTQPSYVMVQAPHRLGTPGEDIKVICQVAGFRDRFKTKDGEYVETARMYLRAVD